MTCHGFNEIISPPSDCNAKVPEYPFNASIKLQTSWATTRVMCKAPWASEPDGYQRYINNHIINQIITNIDLKYKS